MDVLSEQDREEILAFTAEAQPSGRLDVPGALFAKAGNLDGIMSNVHPDVVVLTSGAP